ncbi:MAG TPA: transposase [Syntrophales bacterium]|nr:transposase [Syntrophales bacterium]
MTPGEVNEAHLLSTFLAMHQDNTEKAAHTVVADTKYGTVENYLTCCDLGINAHIPDLKDSQQDRERRRGIFTESAFRYDPGADCYWCPAGNPLKKRNYNPQKDAFEYKCSASICKVCHLFSQCTTSKYGRSLKRHRRQDALDRMRSHAQSFPARLDIRTRQHLMERSFARATRYGFKRARWRRLWRVRIQEYITSAVQNIMVMLRYFKEPDVALKIRASMIPHMVASRLSCWFQELQDFVCSKIFNLSCSNACESWCYPTDSEKGFGQQAVELSIIS